MACSVRDGNQWAARQRRPIAAVIIAVAVLISGATAGANVALTRISRDPYTNPSSTHRTEVEPDTYSFGSTIVSAFQVGRFYDGGATNIGWATSTDSGGTWVKGFLPGITTAKGGPYDRASDPTVAFDAAHDTWLISSLALLSTPAVHGAAVVASRSTDGGKTWKPPVTVATGADLDKNWTVCDNWASSPYYGHCYTQWDDHGAGNLIYMSTSTDGGTTWGPPLTTADAARGLGGQPLVQPDGTVVVPIDNAVESAVLSFRSTNGGASWSAATLVATIKAHDVAGNLRSGPLISAEIDGAGRVYVVWQDCRFIPGCAANDIVMTESADGVNWSAVARIPIHRANGDVDHFIPGLGVDRTTSGNGAHLGLTYHYYPDARCSTSTCDLRVGYVASADGGTTWSNHLALAGPMALTWLPLTTQGYMVGDYISTSFVNGRAYPVFAVAKSPSEGLLREDMYTPTGGLTVPAASGTTSAASALQNPVPDSAPAEPQTAR